MFETWRRRVEALAEPLHAFLQQAASLYRGAAFDPATLTPHFVRGIKLSLSGASAVPTATAGKGIWADILGPDATVTEANKPIKKFTPAADPTPAP